MADEAPDDVDIRALAEMVWRTFLTTGQPPRGYGTAVEKLLADPRMMRWLPSEPRCRICYSPFKGVGGQVMRAALGREPSKLNPQMCNACEQFAHNFPGGAEVETSMLFADVRGSTSLAERLSPAAFRELIDRFYRTSTHVLVHAEALIEKLIGDEVAALFVPGFAGPRHAGRALQAGLRILHATGHGRPGGPWIPVGVGVHTGPAFIGSVGQADGLTDIAALGDAVNIAARIAGQAGAGEVLVSEVAHLNSGLALSGFELRRLQLKGKSEPVDVRVVPASVMFGEIETL